MDEDYLEDLEGLDILAMEEACKRNTLDCIPSKQINLLAVALLKARASQQLRVQANTSKDGKNSSKEFKKRGYNHHAVHRCCGKEAS